MNWIIVLHLFVIYHRATGFTSGKDIAVQLQIWSSFVTVLWRKTEIQNRVWIFVLVRVLWVMISRIFWQFWHSFFKFMFKSSSNFYPIGITWWKWRWSSLFETSVKETATFAYIMTFLFENHTPCRMLTVNLAQGVYVFHVEWHNGG